MAGEIRAILEAAGRWVETSGAQGARALLDGMDLRVVGDAFEGRALAGTYAPRANAVGVSFVGAQLQGASFDGADLRQADFQGADLRGASFIGANLNHARLAEANVRPLILPDGRQLPTRFDGAKTEGAGLGGAG